MSDKPKNQSRPSGLRDDLIVMPINQPIPRGPGIDWWLMRIMGLK